MFNGLNDTNHRAEWHRATQKADMNMQLHSTYGISADQFAEKLKQQGTKSARRLL